MRTIKSIDVNFSLVSVTCGFLRSYLLCTGMLIMISSCAIAASSNNSKTSCDADYKLAFPLVHPSPNNTDFKVYKQAINILNYAVKACPNRVDIYTLMSQAKMALGENAESYQYAKKAVMLDERDWEANYIFGQSLRFKGEIVKGLLHIKRSVANAPDKYRHNVLLGYCSALEDAKQYKMGVETCTEVIDMRNENGAAFYIRARAYEGLGNKQQALQDYKKARALGFEGASYYSKEHYDKK